MFSCTMFAMAVVTVLLMGEVATDTGSSSGVPLQQLGTAVRGTVPTEVEEGLGHVRDSFYAQCRAQGVADPERFVENIRDEAMHCVQDNLNLTEIKADISRHMDNGELDVLFSSRCRDLPPVMLSCADGRLAELQRCLNETERAKDYPGTLMAGLRAAVDFLCFNDGERIAIFLGERGQECVSAEETRRSIRRCLRDRRLSEDAPAALGGLMYGFTAANCRRLFAAHDCVAGALRHCDDPTPSNVVDSLLRAFERPLPCRRPTGAAGPPPLAACLLLLLSSVSAVLLGRWS